MYVDPEEVGWRKRGQLMMGREGITEEERIISKVLKEGGEWGNVRWRMSRGDGVGWMGLKEKYRKILPFC